MVKKLLFGGGFLVKMHYWCGALMTAGAVLQIFKTE
jgi:hypothetical protein